MREINNWNNLEENEVVGFESIQPGIYVARIYDVVDIPEKEYLQIKFDIVDGAKKDFFTKMSGNNLENWSNQGILRQSYKEVAGKFFKAFITAIQKSNANFVWNWNEQFLKGKLMVVVFGEEEYINKDGDLRISCKVREVRSLEAYKKGEIKVPELKKLKNKETGEEVFEDPFKNVRPSAGVTSNDLPF